MVILMPIPSGGGGWANKGRDMPPLSPEDEAKIPAGALYAVIWRAHPERVVRWQVVLFRKGRGTGYYDRVDHDYCMFRWSAKRKARKLLRFHNSDPRVKIWCLK